MVAGVRGSVHHIHSAATISTLNAIGPCGIVWLTCSSQPNATSRTSGGHGALLRDQQRQGDEQRRGEHRPRSRSG